MGIDQAQLDRLRELAEAAKAGGWNEVVAGLDMGDIVLGIREHGSKGDQKAAAEAAGMSVATLWRRAKLAEHRDLIERERPANLTEAWRSVQKLEAEEKVERGEEGEDKPARGRRKRDPLEVLKERLCSTVAAIAQQGLMREADVILAVRGAYRAGVEVKAEYEAALRDQEETEAAAETKAPADVIPLAGRKRSRAKLAVVEGGAGAEPAAPVEADGSTRETEAPRVEESGERTTDLVLAEERGTPVTLVMKDGDRVVVAEVRAMLVAVVKTGQGETVSLGYVNRQNAKAWSRKAFMEEQDPAAVPLAVLRGHRLGVAAVGQLGWGPIGTDKELTWGQLVDRARSCGAEMLLDRLGEPKVDGSTGETGAVA